jgi:ParB/RepB/Spo0J family partition protein
VFDEEALEELKTSIQEVGFLQPIVVREQARPVRDRHGRAPLASGAGDRPETIPAIVRETRDDAMLRDALLENIHRANLNPLEEAAAYQQLLDEFGATHEELAKRIGRSRPQISNTIRLLNLPAPVQRRVAAACCPPATRARCLALTTARPRSSWRSGSSPRACPYGPPRSSCRWPSGRPVEEGGADPAAEGSRARAERSRRPAVRSVRHPRQGRHRPEQGQDHDRVRHRGRSRAHRRHDRRRGRGSARGILGVIGRGQDELVGA